MNLFWLLSVLLVLGGAQSFVFSRFNFKSLKYTRTFSKRSVYEGETVEMVEQIVNRKLLPVPWLRVESRISPDLRFQTAQEEREISEDEQYHKSVFYLGPYSRVTRRHTIKCLHRGDYQLKTVEATAGDLVNMGRAAKQMDVSAHLMVYPKLLSEDQMDMPSRKWQGDVLVKRWIMPDPFLVGGLREYRAGDPMRSVHWGASARTGRMQVKTYDYTADPRLMVVLNVQMQEHQWAELMKYEQDVIEYGISLSATLLTRALEAGVEAGFACNGQLSIRPEQPVVIAPQRASTQGDILLSAMAQLEIKRTLNFHTFLEELSAYQDMDILILSAYDSELIQQGVEQLRARGNSVTLNIIGGGRDEEAV